MITIAHITFNELRHAANFDALTSEYAVECGNDLIGDPVAQFGIYETYETSGKFFIFAAYDAGDLVGFLLMFVNDLAHYGKPVAMTESFFVRQASRSKGVGVHMLRFVEDFAKHHGCKAFMVSAPAGGALEQVAPRWGYTHTNTGFCRSLD